MEIKKSSPYRALAGKGFSLVELLVTVAIIAILSGISVTAYYGSIDASDIRYAMPKIASSIAGLQSTASARQATVVATFVEGEAVIQVTSRSIEKTDSWTIDLRGNQLLKRRLVFRKYQWPDGSKTPRTFTFYPEAQAQGGSVWFGSGFAECEIKLVGNRVDWNI